MSEGGKGREIFPYPSDVGKAVEKAGDALKVSHHYVSEAKAIKEQEPALFQTIHRGSVTLQDAKRQLKKRQKHERLEKVAVRTPDDPDGQFDVLVIDPPCPMQKIDRDVPPDQVAFDYPARRPQATRQNRKLDSPAITILILITSVRVLLRPPYRFYPDVYIFGAKLGKNPFPHVT